MGNPMVIGFAHWIVGNGRWAPAQDKSPENSAGDGDGRRPLQSSERSTTVQDKGVREKEKGKRRSVLTAGAARAAQTRRKRKKKKEKGAASLCIEKTFEPMFMKCSMASCFVF